MLLPELFQIYTERLNQAGLAYMITGSVAGMLFGEPRLTHDIDMVLKLSLADAGRLAEAFPLELFYVPPIESLKLEIRRLNRGHFNLIHHETGFRADVYLEGRDPLHLWAMERRRCIQTERGDFWVAPPEYVIIRKIEFFLEGRSEKHLTDIKSILDLTAIQKEEVVKRLSAAGLEVFLSLVDA